MTWSFGAGYELMDSLSADTGRLEFVPRSQSGLLRALVFAILMHLLVLLGLTAGQSGKREAEVTVLRVRLWISVPVQVAPTPPDSPSGLQPPVVALSSSLQTAAFESAFGGKQLSSQELRRKLDKVLHEIQQRKKQEEREELDRKKSCINPEDESNEDTNQTDREERIDGRIFCDQG
jgi:hypothetical protein